MKIIKRKAPSRKERLQALTDNPLWKAIIGRLVDHDCWVEMVKQYDGSVEPRFISSTSTGGFCSREFYNWLLENDVIQEPR